MVKDEENCVRYLDSLAKIIQCPDCKGGMRLAYVCPQSEIIQACEKMGKLIFPKLKKK